MALQTDTTHSGVFLRVKALHASLKTAELRLADYILEYPGDVVASTIHQLQQKTGSSYATIIRFCKKAGYGGFKEFKNSLAFEMDGQQKVTGIAAGIQIDKSDTIADIVDKTFRSSIKSLEETRGILKFSDVEKAVDAILAARELYLIGTGISGVSAKYAFTRFFRIGINCSYETDPTIYKIKTTIMRQNDVLFAISSSGRSANVVDAARIAYDNGMTIISLCDFAISPLTKISTINLYTTPRNTTQFYDLDMQLLTGQVNIIDVLFFGCCAKMGEKAMDFLHRTKLSADREKI